MLRQLLILALVMAAAAGVPQSRTFAQSPSRPATGERVRVYLAVGTTPVEGRVIGWTADTLVLGAVYPVWGYCLWSWEPSPMRRANARTSASPPHWSAAFSGSARPLAARCWAR
jgi:hypothetical protein